MSVCAYGNVGEGVNVHVFIPYVCMDAFSSFLAFLVTIGFVIVFCLFVTFFHLFDLLLVVIVGSFAGFSGVGSNIHFEIYLYCSSRSRTSSTDSS